MAHRPRKRFGQHFLHDPAVIERILSAIDPKPGENIVEVGPGLGAITLPLLARVDRLAAIEIDRDAAAELARKVGDDSRLSIVVGDALKTDFCRFAQAAKVRVVGNLPYNISTPLLFHLLGQLDCIEDMHFMLQKEVVRRMAARPGGKEYGRLTVMLAMRCKVQPLFDIGPGAFKPPPRVASSFVRLIPDAALWQQLASTQVLQDIVRSAFSGRRKTLRRSLCDLVNARMFEDARVDSGMRPEQLAPADFVRLANACNARRPQAL